MHTLAKQQTTVLRRYNLATFGLGYLVGIALATIIMGLATMGLIQNMVSRFAIMGDTVLSYAAVGWTFLTVAVAVALLQKVEVRAI